MPRTITVSLPSHRTESLLEEIRRLPELITLSAQRDISLQSPGDVVNVEVTDRTLTRLMHVPEGHGTGTDQDISISISEPVGMISASSATAIARDVSSSFEEINFVIGRESTMDLFEMVVMALAGVVVVAGIASNAVHPVIGAVLIAASRSVLTAGVMVALALVSSAASVGAGLATWQADLVWLSLLRWLHDAGIVVGAALVVFVAIRLGGGCGHALTE